MDHEESIPLAGRSTLVLPWFTLFAGVSGMGISFLYLASASRLDVIAGAAGFIAGAILAAAGLLSITVLSRSPGSAGGLPSSLAAFSRTRFVRRWLAHFQRNRENRREPDWQAPVTLTAPLTRTLVKSLEQFQLGDGGGPARLIAWNADHPRAGAPRAATLEKLWFAEEREHARLLGEAVARFGGSRITGHWSFAAFCLVRKCFGVRFELTVLLLTEIASTVYYRLLRRHGEDPALRSVCQLILRDEEGHVAFHRDRLSSSARAGWARHGRCWEIRFRLLGLAAAWMLWINHAPALLALGASRGEFYQEVWLGLSRFVRRLRRESAQGLQAGLPEAQPLCQPI
jgi:hypothetical protein